MVQGEYKLGRCSRRCSVEDRPLQPGEAYYSVVEIAADASDEETLVRRDISARAWQGPPEGNLGWWKNRMPEAGSRKLKLAPDAVLVDLMRRSLELRDSIEEDQATATAFASTPSSSSASSSSASSSPASSSSAEGSSAVPTGAAQAVSGGGVTQGPLLFLFALMLMRRRLIQTIDTPEGAQTSGLADARMWFEFCDDGSRFSVPHCRVSSAEAQRLGDSLVELLYCEVD